MCEISKVCFASIFLIYGTSFDLLKFLNKRSLHRFDLSNVWNKQSSVRLDLSYFWNKQRSLRFDLFKLWNKQSSLGFDLFKFATISNICQDRSFVSHCYDHSWALVDL